MHLDAGPISGDLGDSADCLLIDESEATNETISREVNMLLNERYALQVLAGLLTGWCWLIGSIGRGLSVIAMASSFSNSIAAITIVVFSIHCLSRISLIVPYIQPLLDTIAAVRICTRKDSSSLPAHELSPPDPSLADKIKSFYTEHCPDKLSDLSFPCRIAAKYSYPGGEEALFASLNKRYN